MIALGCPTRKRARRLLRYSLTCTKICIPSLAQARPDEASRRLTASAGRGNIAKIFKILRYSFFIHKFSIVSNFLWIALRDSRFSFSNSCNFLLIVLSDSRLSFSNSCNFLFNFSKLFENMFIWPSNTIPTTNEYPREITQRAMARIYPKKD